MAREKVTPKHYVDNKLLLVAMMDYKESVRANNDLDRKPRISSYIGECIMKIATHLAHKPNFANYTFRDEMISDGIENCIQYIDNFDSNKSNNPFAYFTQIIYYAFIRRIQKEKKYLYTKHAVTIMAEITNMTTNSQNHDNNNYGSDAKHGEWTQEQMETFMEDFEEKQKNKKAKSKKERGDLING